MGGFADITGVRPTNTARDFYEIDYLRAHAAMLNLLLQYQSYPLCSRQKYRAPFQLPETVGLPGRVLGARAAATVHHAWRTAMLRADFDWLRNRAGGRLNSRVKARFKDGSDS